MENASKALMIAGGVLISIIIISVLVNLFTQVQDYRKGQETIVEAKELAEFNKQFEAYHRNNVYGTEVVSVINKAISNNEKHSDEYKQYDIDVTFKLVSDPIKSYDVIYQPSRDASGTIIKNQVTSTIRPLGDEKFKKNTVYHVVAQASDKDDDHNRINDAVENFFFKYQTKKEATKDLDGKTVNLADQEKKAKDEYNYIIHNTGFTDFKRRTFRCTEMKYSSETGRVNFLSFEENSSKSLNLEGD